jgi:hypothetical protein
MELKYAIPLTSLVLLVSSEVPPVLEVKVPEERTSFLLYHDNFTELKNWISEILQQQQNLKDKRVDWTQL